MKVRVAHYAAHLFVHMLTRLSVSALLSAEIHKESAVAEVETHARMPEKKQLGSGMSVMSGRDLFRC
jgi:hypothetical protein